MSADRLKDNPSAFWHLVSINQAWPSFKLFTPRKWQIFAEFRPWCSLPASGVPRSLALRPFS